MYFSIKTLQFSQYKEWLIC